MLQMLRIKIRFESFYSAKFFLPLISNLVALLCELDEATCWKLLNHRVSFSGRIALFSQIRKLLWKIVGLVTLLRLSVGKASEAANAQWTDEMQH